MENEGLNKPVPAKRISGFGMMAPPGAENNDEVNVSVYFLKHYECYNPTEVAWFPIGHAQSIIKSCYGRRATLKDMSIKQLRDLNLYPKDQLVEEIKIEEPDKEVKAKILFGTSEFNAAVEESENVFRKKIISEVLRFYHISRDGRGRSQEKTTWCVQILRQLCESKILPEKFIPAPYFDASMDDIYQDEWDNLLKTVG